MSLSSSLSSLLLVFALLDRLFSRDSCALGYMAYVMFIANCDLISLLVRCSRIHRVVCTSFFCCGVVAG